MDLIKGFEVVPYITNPFALLAYMFLVIMIVLAALKINPVLKIVSLLLLASFVLYLTFNLVEDTTKLSLRNMAKNSLLHLVKDEERVDITPRVMISLDDIETLKGKKNWEFNKKLDDLTHVFDEVFKRAGINRPSVSEILAMESSEWKKFLKGLEDNNDLEEKLKAEKIKDIPFAKLSVFVDGVEVKEFRHKYYFKNEHFDIYDESGDSTIAIIEVVNIYNTKHRTSKESEAVNIRIVDGAQSRPVMTNK
jgi:hypothetical protein